MAVYAIGDLQGCIDPLRRLLDHVRFDPSSDHLWFCGDLVNRGPGSLHTLRFVKSLGESAVAVLGNHDLHLLAVAYDPQRTARNKDTLEDILCASDRDELLEWLRRRPLLHHDPSPGYTMVHAGLPPDWDLDDAKGAARELEAVLAGPDFISFLRDMYGDRPDRWSPGLTGMDRLRFIVNCFTRLRYCHPDGRIELDEKGPPDRAAPGLVPWFRIPGRRSRLLKIVFGHWSTLGPVDDEGVFALDTGCVWGGRLTALRLDGPPRRIHVECGPGLAPTAVAPPGGR
jgi:bis(5'-nucleosyl)-tetraphosphatase (symmetrical)